MGPLVDGVGARGVMSVVDSMVPSCCPVGRMSLLLCSGGLGSFYRFVRDLCFYFIICTVVVLLVTERGRRVFVGGMIRFCIMGGRMSPLWCTEYGRGVVRSSGSTGRFLFGGDARCARLE